jgi:nickel-type superoxide dismutase maturation protease
MKRRTSVTILVTVAASGATLFCLGRIRRLEVEGESMVPALFPGDRVLVLRVPRWWPVGPGRLVAFFDPRPVTADEPRMMVKRVTSSGPEGLEVLGDNGEASTDSRDFGPVARAAVSGVVIYRYAPAERRARLGVGTGH